MKTLEDVMDKSWKKSRGQNRTERFNDVAEAIRSYYLSLLDKDEYDGDDWDKLTYACGYNQAIDEMKKRIEE